MGNHTTNIINYHDYSSAAFVILINQSDVLVVILKQCLSTVGFLRFSPVIYTGCDARRPLWCVAYVLLASHYLQSILRAARAPGLGLIANTFDNFESQQHVGRKDPGRLSGSRKPRRGSISFMLRIPASTWENAV